VETVVAERRTKPCEIARTYAISHKRIETLQDLMRCIEGEENEKSKVVPMLRALTSHICLCYDRAPERIAVSELADLRPRLRLYLQKGPFKRNSIRSYVNYLRILLDRAEQLGWRKNSPEIENKWVEIRAHVSTAKSGSQIVHWAIAAGKSPADFTDGDLDLCAAEQTRLGRGFEYVRNLKARFRKSIVRAGLTNQLPKLSFGRRDCYGVPLSGFPELMRAQLKEVVAWKTAAFVTGRPRGARYRAVSAMSLLSIVGRLFGFICTVLRKQVNALTELLTQENVSKYAEWCLNERKLCTNTLTVWVGMIGALGRHPLLGGKSFAWARELIASLPPATQGRTQQLKAQKWVDYDELSKIPDRILEDARRTGDLRQKALLVRGALMLQWLLILPWRQRNVRQCRLASSMLGGNLFKERISPMATVAKPKWVEEALRTNPDQEFWQFRFGSDETKNGDQVHAILPKQLIGLLEQYLEVHRPLLVNGVDPGTLFLNNGGRSYSEVTIEVTIGRLTAHYAGRRVTPHLFRDIFAVKYLEECPEDYLTLSKILWHRDIQTTLRIYGARFDESHGVRRVEQWLDDRETRNEGVLASVERGSRRPA
jgi:integrase